VELGSCGCRLSSGVLGWAAVGVETAAKLTSKNTVDDEVDGRVGRDQQVTDVIVVEIYLYS